jgi:hypothetical protein
MRKSVMAVAARGGLRIPSPLAAGADASRIHRLVGEAPECAVPQHTDLERELQLIETTLRKLETEYNQYFAGQSKRPPLDTRRRLDQMIDRLDRAYITSPVDRFRLGTLQSRYATFSELWDRALRAREEGRPGPFSKPARAGASAPSDASNAPAPPVATPTPPRPVDRVFGSVTLNAADAEADKVRALYETLVKAREAAGTTDPFPFSRFADIVKGQVAKFQQSGSSAVAFRVSTREGRVVFTARGRKTTSEDQPE